MQQHMDLAAAALFQDSGTTPPFAAAGLPELESWQRSFPHLRVLGAKCSVQPSCEGLQLGMTVESGQMHSSENLTIDCTPCSSQSNWCSETFASHGSFDQQPVEPESGIHEQTSTKCNEECINDSLGSPELVSDLCTLVWARVVAALVPVLIATHRWQPQLEPPRTAAAAFARPSCYGGPQLVSSSAAVSKPHRAPLSAVVRSTSSRGFGSFGMTVQPQQLHHRVRSQPSAPARRQELPKRAASPSERSTSPAAARFELCHNVRPSTMWATSRNPPRRNTKFPNLVQVCLPASVHSPKQGARLRGWDTATNEAPKQGVHRRLGLRNEMCLPDIMVPKRTCGLNVSSQASILSKRKK